MRLNEIVANQFDDILKHLCDMVVTGQERDAEKYGMVAACVVDSDGNKVYRRNYLNKDDEHRTHAERAAIEAYERLYGDLPEGSIVVTTLSPCSEHMSDREGASCTDLLNSKGIAKVYCGYMDPTQSQDGYEFSASETNNERIRKQCKAFADTFL
jgi:pyrimidine deaminase RibD-like protein